MPWVLELPESKPQSLLELFSVLGQTNSKLKYKELHKKPAPPAQECGLQFKKLLVAEY